MEDYRVTRFTTFGPGTGSRRGSYARGAQRHLRRLRRRYHHRLWTTLPGWFWRHWDQTAPVDPLVLRTTIIRLYFDGAQEPLCSPVGISWLGAPVTVPVGLLGHEQRGFYCYFPMPLSGIPPEVENLHPQETVEIFFNLSCRLARATGRCGRVPLRLSLRRESGR